MKEYLKQEFEKYIQGEEKLLYETSLVKQLAEYSPFSGERQIRLKAFRIYRKCLRAGKENLAAKIKKKYDLGNPANSFRSDMVDAFGIALMANKQIK